MISTRIHQKSVFCPNCDENLDAVFSITTDSLPEKDDYTLCGYCGSLLQFNEDLTYRDGDIDFLRINDPKTYKYLIELMIVIKSNKGLPFKELKERLLDIDAPAS